jgi:hypothetical protein
LYPPFVVKIPKRMGVVDASLGDPFFLMFEEIFNMFHLKPLHQTFVCLMDLNMHPRSSGWRPLVLAIIDFFFMLESTLRYPRDQALVTKYIEDFLVANYKKEVILVSYFPK